MRLFFINVHNMMTAFFFVLIYFFLFMFELFFLAFFKMELPLFESSQKSLIWVYLFPFWFDKFNSLLNGDVVYFHHEGNHNSCTSRDAWSAMDQNIRLCEVCIDELICRIKKWENIFWREVLNIDPHTLLNL